MAIERITAGLAGLLLLTLAAGCERPTAPALAYSRSDVEAMRQVLNAGVSDEAGGGPAALAEPTGFATLTGRFRIDGPAPSRSPLTVNKDVEVCAPGGTQVLDEAVVVGPDGGLKNVLIYVSSTVPAEDPAWIHADYLAQRFGEVEFDQKNCIFLSHVATMQSTQKLKVLNSDPVGHNTNLDSKRGAAAANFTVAANSYQYYEPRAASPSPFSVTCSIHPWMSAYMMVCDHPFMAVTAEDGSFEIPNVPAGVELEFRVWQERAGYLEEVTVNDQATKWSKGRFKLQLSPDDRYEMNVVINNAALR